MLYNVSHADVFRLKQCSACV